MSWIVDDAMEHFLWLALAQNVAWWKFNHCAAFPCGQCPAFPFVKVAHQEHSSLWSSCICDTLKNAFHFVFLVRRCGKLDSSARIRNEFRIGTFVQIVGKDLLPVPVLWRVHVARFCFGFHFEQPFVCVGTKVKPTTHN